MAMTYYVAFTALCLVLAILHLNRNKGSSRVYPSTAAVLVFGYIMWAYADLWGFGFENALNGCFGGIVCGFVVYWLTIFVQNNWDQNGLRKALAIVLMVAGCFISVPTYLLGRGVLHLYREKFAQADADVEEKKQEKERLLQEEEEKRRRRETEILEKAKTDDDLCRFFAELYSRMGYEPRIERTQEQGPLRVFLRMEEESYAFVAIARKELLGADAVEWAATFRGEAKKAGIVTVGTFSKRAVRRANRLGVALVDLPNLPKIVRAAKRKERKELLRKANTGEN